LVVRIARRWPSGKRSCAIHASKSSSRQATADGRSLAYVDAMSSRSRRASAGEAAW
jgi:hypothetical protein